MDGRVSDHSPGLRLAIQRLWATMADDYGLIAEIELDTVLARTKTGDAADVVRGLPRLLSALVDGELSPVEGIEVMELLHRDHWSDSSRSVMLDVLDAWWFDVLQRDSAEHHPGLRPDAVLGLLAHSPAPMVRWLHPWLDELDGPASTHLAEAVVAGFPSPTWAGREDERQQVMAWTRSETVVNGLTLVGATHIDSATMSRMLDVLILGEDVTDG